MFDLDKWQEIFATIGKNKLRTALTAMGVLWGIFMLMVLLGAGRGMENGVLGMFGKRATNSLFVWGQRTTMPYKGFNVGRRPQFNMDDVEAIRESFPQIAYVAPRLDMRNTTFIYGQETGAYEIRGELPDFIKIDPVDVYAGRFINQFDVKERRKVIVIGERIKEVLFGKEDAIGKYVRAGGIDYMVVGVFKPYSTTGDSAELAEIAIIPITTAQQILNRPNQIDWFVCSMHNNVKVSGIQDDLKGLLRSRHNVHPDDKNGIGSWNMEEEFNQFTGLFSAINMFVWFVGIGTLFAGIVGVGNVMLIIVKERTKEIGIRKAMGATPNSIISMILLESVFITTISGYVGLLLGTGLISIWAYGMKEFNIESEFFANPEINIAIGFQALLILIIAGAIAGLIPALHAAKINPVDALRDE